MSALSRSPSLPRYLNPVLRAARTLDAATRGSAPPGTPQRQVLRDASRGVPHPYRLVAGLAYNNNANWALNILAAGGGEISRGGRSYALSQPRKRGAQAREDLPAPIGYMMPGLGIEEFIECDAARKW